MTPVIADLLSRLTPAAIDALARLLTVALTSSDPTAALTRATEEEARVQAFDAFQARMRKGSNP